MSAKALATALGLALMAGCAGDAARSDLLDVPEDHPAHPKAAVAPLPKLSNTLNVAAAASTAPASTAPASTAPAPHAAAPAAASTAANAPLVQQDGLEHAAGHHAGQSATAPSAAPHHHAQQPASTRGSTQPASKSIYACPHHPQVTSEKPGQRCPRCGMPLEEKQAKPAHRTKHEGH